MTETFDYNPDLFPAPLNRLILRKANQWQVAPGAALVRLLKELEAADEELVEVTLHEVQGTEMVTYPPGTLGEVVEFFPDGSARVRERNGKVLSRHIKLLGARMAASERVKRGEPRPYITTRKVMVSKSELPSLWP